MNNGSSKKDSGGVEVVADQADDGSYELRFEKQKNRLSDDASHTPATGIERQELSRENSGSTPAVDTGVWRAQDADVEARSARPIWPRYALGGAMLALLVLGIIALTTLGGDRQPTTVEVAEPAFQGVFVDTPPLVIEEMVIVEEADDATDAVTSRPDIEQARPSNAAAVRIPTNSQGARGLNEPVIDDVVRSALDNVAREDARQREEEARRAAADRMERERLAQQEEDNPEMRRPSDDDPAAEQYYENDEFYDDEEPYEDDEYYDDDEYPAEDDADFPRDEGPLEDPY